MFTAIKELKRARLGGAVAFLTVLLLAAAFAVGSPAILEGRSTLAFQVGELQDLGELEAAPALVYGSRTGPDLAVARVSTRNHSVWFGEVFTDQFTLSDEKAKAIASSDSNTNEPEWYSAARLRFTLEELGFEVVRGLSIPSKEELSSFDMLIIPIPNQRILTADDFLDTAMDLVFQGTSLLIFLDETTPPYINGLTQEFGVTVHRGTVLYPELRRDRGAFDITNIDHDHPITDGISSIRVNWSAPMTMSPPKLDAKVKALAFAPDEMVAGRERTPGRYVYAVAVEYGKGKIAIVADQTSFRGFGNEGEIGFNTLRWLSTQTAASAASPGQQTQPGRQRPEPDNQRSEPQSKPVEERRQQDLLRKQEELRRAFDRRTQVQAGRQALNLLDPSNPLRANLPTRGFFTNSSSGEFSDIDKFMDPTSLAVFGILLTLLATSLSLFKGS